MLGKFRGFVRKMLLESKISLSNKSSHLLIPVFEKLKLP